MAPHSLGTREEGVKWRTCSWRTPQTAQIGESCSLLEGRGFPTLNQQSTQRFNHTPFQQYFHTSFPRMPRPWGRHSQTLRATWTHSRGDMPRPSYITTYIPVGDPTQTLTPGKSRHSNRTHMDIHRGDTYRSSETARHTKEEIHPDTQIYPDPWRRHIQTPGYTGTPSNTTKENIRPPDIPRPHGEDTARP